MSALKGFALIAIIVVVIVAISGCIGGGETCPKCGATMDSSSSGGESGWWVCPDCHYIEDPNGGSHQAGYEDGEYPGT